MSGPIGKSNWKERNEIIIGLRIYTAGACKSFSEVANVKVRKVLWVMFTCCVINTNAVQVRFRSLQVHSPTT